MPDKEPRLISYTDVLQELEKSKPNNHLLLGNGFNLSLGIKTDYKSILIQMKKNNKEYESVITGNFDLEEFIGACKSQIIEADNPYFDFMKRYIQNKIKLDFMKAVTEIVSKEMKNIAQVEKEEIYLLLKQFDSYFTLNYDPFLYQLLMSYKKDDKKRVLVIENTLPFIKEQMENSTQAILKEIENGYKSGILTINMGVAETQLELSNLNKSDFEKEMKLYFGTRVSKKELKKVIDHFWKNKDSTEKREIETIDDGFGLFGKEIIFKNPQTQNLIFLHGAFHIYQRGKVIYKITQQSEKALYQKIEEVVEDADENIICVFSDTNKEIEIAQNEYLRNGLNKLSDIEGTLLIIGSSLADNDSHIFEKVNQSKIHRIFIASCEKDKAKDFKNANKFWSGKEIILFDRDTVSYAK